MGNEERDVVLLDTTSRVVYYINCPAQIKETALPRSNYLVYPLDRDKLAANRNRSDNSGDNRGFREGCKGEDEDEEDDANNNNLSSEEDGDQKEDHINWGLS